MNILAVDTSSDRGSAVVQAGGVIAAQVRPETSIEYSENLFGAIEELLERAGLSIDQIDMFAAARGPGSFTGLRIGLAAMAGFAFATGKPSAGVSTLAALAWQVGCVPEAIVPLLDARRGEVYTARFQRRPRELVELSAPAVLQPAEWFQSLGGQPVVFCGPAADSHRSAIASDAAWRIDPVSPYLATAIAEIAASPAREPLEPLYLRRTSAEINRARHGGRVESTE